MKTQYFILLIVLIISCKESKTPTPDVSAKTSLEEAEIIKTETLDERGKEASLRLLNFKEVIASIPLRDLPLEEKTSFDDFIEAGDYQEIEEVVLQLQELYPDLNKKNSGFNTNKWYRLNISKAFYTIVVTIQKNENEIETVLINYALNGQIIDSKIVSYDEVAESRSKVVSKISENKLTVHRTFWSEMKKIEQEEYILHTNGEIEKINAINLNESIKEFALVDNVLTELQLSWIQTKTNLITTREHMENPNETIVVIPEIVDESEQYFTLNSHIVIADNRSGKITHKYFESPQTNEWVSDAIALTEIELDTVPYNVAEDKVAFGLNVSYFGSSRVNPYSNKTLSLFVKSGDNLIKVLSNYSIKDYSGEWDGDCNGEFIEKESIIALSNKKSNGYYDLLIEKKFTYTKNVEDIKGECLGTETYETKKTTLKYNEWRYSEYDSETISYSEFHPQKLDSIQIDNFQVGQVNIIGKHKIASAFYQTRDKQKIDTEKDWGDKLLMLDASNKIVYESHGVGDPYLFEPHFYKSKTSNKIIIICQLAFEYPFGGEAFIVENGKIDYIGTLNIEAYDENFQNYLTEVVEIKENATGIEFTLKSDKLVIKPGSKGETIINNNLKYVYKNNELKLLPNNP